MEKETITQPEENLVKEFAPESKKSTLKEIVLPAGTILVIILAGVATGYIFANRRGKGASLVQTTKLSGGVELVQGPKEAGIKDEETFRDTAIGKLEVNSNNNISEGSHKLIRPGGQSQTAYLTSSAVDLDQFTGKCVQIWGETFAAQQAGWLMDVGRVKVIDSCPEGI